jgi:predicted branched-subunit amino acid permease
MSEFTKNPVRDSLSVALTVGAYGVAFGAASVAAGFSVLQTCLFSLLTFTGASQFAAVGVVASGGAAASAIAAATMLGTRNALYAIQMAPLLRVKGLRRVAAAHLTIDESTGVALSQASRGTAAMRLGFWLTGSGVFVFWNIFTLLGLVWPRLENNFLRLVATASMAFALVITPWLPAGLSIIASALVAVAMGWRAR